MEQRRNLESSDATVAPDGQFTGVLGRVPGPSLRSGPPGACGGLDPPSARPAFRIYRIDREYRARNKGMWEL